MDSLLIHQQANDLVQNLGTRNIKKIALHVGMEISETDCFHDLLGLFASSGRTTWSLLTSALTSTQSRWCVGMPSDIIWSTPV